MQGGALLSALVAYAQHGDPYLRTSLDRMMQIVAAPVLTMISAWISDGELLPPTDEFFIRTHHEGDAVQIMQWLGDERQETGVCHAELKMLSRWHHGPVAAGILLGG